MTEETDKRSITRQAEIYESEGGKARYPEGFKIRGHDANELLDRARGTGSKPDSEEPSEPASK